MSIGELLEMSRRIDELETELNVLKDENVRLINALSDIRNHTIVWKKEPLENAKLFAAINARASKALAAWEERG